MTLLGQTALRGSRLTVQPDGVSWELTIHEEDPQLRSGRVPFAFILLPHEAEGIPFRLVRSQRVRRRELPLERIGTGSYRFSDPVVDGSSGVLQITPGANLEGDAPLMRLCPLENGVWELLFQVDGNETDAPFAWAWIASDKAPPPKIESVEERVLAALEDTAYADFGWYYSARLAWIYVAPENWPWVWSPRSGWLYLFLDTAPSDGLWFFESDNGAYVYVDRNYFFWAYSTQDGWIPWNREFI